MSDKTLITAHSGSDGTPDNSLACVRYALSTAADAFEVDVRRLSDGTLALGHDVADHTAPTLREVFTLAAAKPGVRVNCDLKERGLEPDVAALAAECGMAGRLIFSGSVDVNIFAAHPELHDCAEVYLNIEEYVPDLYLNYRNIPDFELTAAGIYMQYWLPDVPTWVWAAAFFIIINAVNLVNVRLYGEAEFWFALIKVLAIIGMIAFGLWMLFGGHGGSKAGFDNLWKHGGFLATGWHGLILSLAVIMFSFGGLELIGITAAEAQNPEKSIPKAVNQVVYRILLFYIGSLVVLLALYPWVETNPTAARL